MLVAPSVNKSTCVGALTAVALAGKIGGASCMNTKGKEYLITFGCVNSIGCRLASGIMTGALKAPGNIMGNGSGNSSAKKYIRLAP